MKSKCLILSILLLAELSQAIPVTGTLDGVITEVNPEANWGAFAFGDSFTGEWGYDKDSYSDFLNVRFLSGYTIFSQGGGFMGIDESGLPTLGVFASSPDVSVSDPWIWFIGFDGALAASGCVEFHLNNPTFHSFQKSLSVTETGGTTLLFGLALVGILALGRKGTTCHLKS